jgi:hypothetical protein
MTFNQVPAIYSTIQLSMCAAMGIVGVILVLQNGTEVPNTVLVALVALLLMKDAIAMGMSAILTGGN